MTVHDCTGCETEMACTSLVFVGLLDDVFSLLRITFAFAEAEIVTLRSSSCVLDVVSPLT